MNLYLGVSRKFVSRTLINQLNMALRFIVNDIEDIM